jgi:glutathione S-transferase
VPSGSSPDTRPALTQFVRSRLCVARAGPSWGKPAAGHASAKTLKTTRLSELAPRLARPGVQPGAYISIADAALVPENHLAALGDSLCRTRLPASYSACERVSAEAGAHNRWAAVGVLAQPPPTKHRPTPC